MTYEQGSLPPSYDASFERAGISDDPTLKGGEFVGQEFPLKVGLRVHPNNNGVIVVSYPGYNGDINGYAGKYETLAGLMQERIGAVLRTDNPHYGGFRYDVSVQDHLRAVVDYAMSNLQEIAGQPAEETSMYLMGFSAGAGAIAAVAHEFPQVKKVLLMAPSGDAGEEAVTKGLREYSGECNIVIGEDDEVVGVKSAELFASLATGASVVRTAIIPDCDHQFRGELNGRIMSAAPLWAFTDRGGETPSPTDGIKLYE
jgi:dienelactone hydrolase